MSAASEAKRAAFTGMLDFWRYAMEGNFESACSDFAPDVDATLELSGNLRSRRKTNVKTREAAIAWWQKQGCRFAPTSLNFSIDCADTKKIYRYSSGTFLPSIQCDFSQTWHPIRRQVQNTDSTLNRYVSGAPDPELAATVQQAFSRVLSYWTDLINHRFDAFKNHFDSNAHFTIDWIEGENPAGKVHDGIEQIQEAWASFISEYGDCLTPTQTYFSVNEITDDNCVAVIGNHTLSIIGLGALGINDIYFIKRDTGKIWDLRSWRNQP